LVAPLFGASTNFAHGSLLDVRVEQNGRAEVMGCHTLNDLIGIEPAA
jgi:hypothetical protein